MQDALRIAVLAKGIEKGFILDHDRPHGISLYIGEPPHEDKYSKKYHEAHLYFADVLLHIDFYDIENTNIGTFHTYHVEFNDYPTKYTRHIVWFPVSMNKKNIPRELAKMILNHLRLEWNYVPTSLECRDSWTGNSLI